MRKYVRSVTVVALMVLSSISAKAALTSDDFKVQCGTDSADLYIYNALVVPHGGYSEIALSDLSSKCAQYLSNDVYFETSVNFYQPKVNPSDLMRRLKLKIEVIDGVTGLPLSSVAQQSCYAGNDVFAAYLSNLQSILRPLKIRISNGGSKDQAIYPEVHYTNKTLWYNICGG